MNKLFAGVILLALASLAPAAPQPTKTEDQAADKKTEQKHSRKGNKGSNQKMKKETKSLTDTAPTVKK